MGGERRDGSCPRGYSLHNPRRRALRHHWAIQRRQICVSCCTGEQIRRYLIFLCPISDSIFGLLQNFIHGPVSCAPFPNQSAFIQNSYDGCAVAIPPDFDPPIFDPASDIGVLFSEAITRGVLRFGGLFACWWRRIDQMETKGNRMFAKSVVRHGWTGAVGDQPL